jgi:hypothetical protein
MSDQKKKERRKHKRIPFREDIVIDGSKLCTSNDISEGGMYVSAISSFEEHNTIDVTIPYKDKKIVVKARIQYCQPGIGMGIMFVDLDETQKSKLKALIDTITE